MGREQMIYCRTMLICPKQNDIQPADECIHCEFFLKPSGEYIICKCPKEQAQTLKADMPVQANQEEEHNINNANSIGETDINIPVPFGKEWEEQMQSFNKDELIIKFKEMAKSKLLLQDELNRMKGL